MFFYEDEDEGTQIQVRIIPAAPGTLAFRIHRDEAGRPWAALNPVVGWQVETVQRRRGGPIRSYASAILVDPPTEDASPDGLVLPDGRVQLTDWSVLHESLSLAVIAHEEERRRRENEAAGRLLLEALADAAAPGSP